MSLFDPGAAKFYEAEFEALSDEQSEIDLSKFGTGADACAIHILLGTNGECEDLSAPTGKGPHFYSRAYEGVLTKALWHVLGERYEEAQALLSAAAKIVAEAREAADNAAKRSAVAEVQRGIEGANEFMRRASGKSSASGILDGDWAGPYSFLLRCGMPPEIR